MRHSKEARMAKRLSHYLDRVNRVHLLIMTILLLVCIGLEYYLNLALGITGAYAHLFYVPLFIAAFWWGFWGGLSVGIFLALIHLTSYLPDISQLVLAESLAFALVGSATGVIGSERIRAERKLRQAYDEEVKLRRDLQAEMERRVEFTRALVHELKTPLTPVLASSELLIEELRREPFLSLARNINRGALSLNEKIDELLDLARGEIGMLRLKLKQIDPSPLLRSIADEISSLVASQGQSLILDLSEPLPSVTVDENRLRQVILNLLNNACKFTPEGGTIVLRTKRRGTRLAIEVEDTGPGIPLEEQQLIFEPYYRARSGQIYSGGLGLGLPLCKTLVELHGGQMWVKSQENKGSVFGLSLPL
ncbi:MAG: HAMP domain-containing histidine kinase [Chloroflexi bacterium]|nr:HAMP domain-containing histidine kinase [Chloroflexota bacterium]MBM3175989.1 HAMP domain-containing histidine kinase [Chloroflexota bacterium]